jgi:O-antigen/teichoic acid export membrane protein
MKINQLKAGTALSYVSIGLNSLIGLIYTPFMLRMMGQSEYGLYSLAASIIAYLTILDLGFGNALIRYTAKFRAENKQQEQSEMFGMFLMLYSVISIFTLLIGSVLYFNIGELFNETMSVEELYKVRIILILMLFNLAFTFPMSIWQSIITAYEQFVFQKVLNIIRIILNPIIMMLLLTIGYRAIAMVVVTTLFNVTTLIIDYWYCKKKLKIKVCFGRIKWCFLKEVSFYSFWIFLDAIVDRIYWSSGQFILGMYIGTAAIAVYAVAIQLQSMYMSFSTAISGVFLPKVTAMVMTEKNEKKISDLFIRIGRIQYIVISFILVGFILFGRQFVILWAGSAYEEAYYIALLFFVPLLPPLIQNLGITILQARNQMKFRSILYFFISVVSIGISIPLAQRYGGIGCAVATAIALSIGQGLVMNIYYKKVILLDITQFWKEIIKMSIIPVLLGSIAFFILIELSFLYTFTSLSIAVFIFTLIYIPCFWFGSMNVYERNLFKKPILQLLRRRLQ